MLPNPRTKAGITADTSDSDTKKTCREERHAWSPCYRHSLVWQVFMEPISSSLLDVVSTWGMGLLCPHIIMAYIYVYLWSFYYVFVSMEFSRFFQFLPWCILIPAIGQVSGPGFRCSQWENSTFRQEQVRIQEGGLGFKLEWIQKIKDSLKNSWQGILGEILTENFLLSWYLYII